MKIFLKDLILPLEGRQTQFPYFKVKILLPTYFGINLPHIVNKLTLDNNLQLSLKTLWCLYKADSYLGYIISIINNEQIVPKSKQTCIAYSTGSIIHLFDFPNFKTSNLTLSISRIVLQTINSMMKFSKGAEVTSLQMWYRGPLCSSGTYNSKGLASIAKLMQDFWFLSMSS